MKTVTLDSAGNVASVNSFATDLEAVYITQGPDGNLYYVEFTTGNIWRIKYNGVVAHASATPTNGYSPLSVTFSSSGSRDPNGGALTYSWDFGDGASSTAANPVHTYSGTGVLRFNAKLTVTNSSGSDASDTVLITLGSTPPSVNIASPSPHYTVSDIGDVVTYSGSATDPDDGPLTGSALLWTILLHHNDHVHTVQQTTGSTGTFTIEDHDSVNPFWYEVILTATDSSGLSTSANAIININRPAGTLSGRVTNAKTGAGVGTATVVVTGGPSTTADSSGTYAFSNLSSGTFNVTASKTGYLSRTLTVTIPSGSGATLNIPIAAAGKIAGTVADASGAPLSGATVTVSGGVVAITKSFTTSSTGTYNTSWVPVGDYTVTARAAAGSTSATTTVATGATSTVNLRLGSPSACSLSSPGAKICNPVSGSTVSSPVHLVTTSKPTAGHNISAQWVYVDSAVVLKSTQANLDTNVAVPGGTHQLRIQVWDGGGNLFKDAVTVTVNGSSGCSISTPGAIVCEPTNGATVSSPVHFVAKAFPSSGRTISAIWVYVDNVNVYRTTDSTVDTNLTVAAGTHNIRIQAWDTSGALFKAGVDVTVR